jgi:hypothetical protein
MLRRMVALAEKKDALLQSIGRFFTDRLKLQKRAKGNYWFNDNGFAKLLFFVDSARFMDCFYVSAGIYYNNLAIDGKKKDPKKVPIHFDWHLGANIGHVYQRKPTLVEYDISEVELNDILGKIQDVVVPFTDDWRSKEYLKTYPDIIKSPWQKRLSRDTLRKFADTL